MTSVFMSRTENARSRPIPRAQTHHLSFRISLRSPSISFDIFQPPNQVVSPKDPYYWFAAIIMDLLVDVSFRVSHGVMDTGLDADNLDVFLVALSLN